MLTKYEHYYELKKQGFLNNNWIYNSYDNSIWNIKTGTKLSWSNWSNRSRWNININR